MFEEHATDLGPVLVTVRYVIDPAKAQAFVRFISMNEFADAMELCVGVFSLTRIPKYLFGDFPSGLVARARTATYSLHRFRP